MYVCRVVVIVNNNWTTLATFIAIYSCFFLFMNCCCGCLYFFIAHVASSVTFKIHTHPHTFINLLIFAFLYVCLPSKSFNLSIKKASAIHKDIKKSIRIHSHRERVFFLSTFYNACKWNMDYYRLILLIEVSKHLDRPLILLICAVLSCNWFVSVQ